MSASPTPELHEGEAPSAAAGPLTAAEVAERQARGDGNRTEAHVSRSYGDIFRANVLTRINAMYLVLFLLILGTGYLLDGLFVLLIVVNSVVGMVQEIRAKRTLDRLALLNQSAVRVERAEGVQEVAPEEIVRDDIVLVAAGDQIPVDGAVIDAVGLEVDESLLTGESEPVQAGPGTLVMSGSFVAAGSARFRATAVGAAAYASRLASEAAEFRKPSSQLRSGIDRILKYITWLLIPVGLITILNQIFGDSDDWREAVRGLVAALVPMVPEGLVLMTSVAMAVGVIRLGQRNCLVQDLPAIEQLARVDVVCTDKTGTLTEDGMRVSRVEPVAGAAGAGGGTAESASGGSADRAADGAETPDVRAVLAAIGRAEGRPNSSMAAILEYAGAVESGAVQRSVPFSSARKWAAAQFSAGESWVLGAPDVLLEDRANPARQRADELSELGLRVLALGRMDGALPAEGLGALEPVALVVLEQRLRPEAPEAIAYFAQQGIEVKVISGDNAQAVGVIAADVGVPNGRNAVDARELEGSDDFAGEVRGRTAFGRVTPAQKRQMVHALQADGRTVAMTGDGVNDVLALKDSDVGVAMGSGSPAARSVSRIVLLDNSFATLPHVIAEGRRVIGNIERVASLFLTKTLYSILLALVVAVSGVPFPFLPRHVTLIAFFTIGVPAFFLALAPNDARAQDGFVRRVLDAAIPGGIGAAAAAYGAYLTARSVIGIGPDDRVLTSSTAFLALIIVAFAVLLSVARPYARWKVALVASMAVSMLVIILTPLGARLSDLNLYDWRAIAIGVGFGVGGVILRFVVRWSISLVRSRRRAAVPG